MTLSAIVGATFPVGLIHQYQILFDVALEYSSGSKPMSIRRTLRGSSQAWGQLEVVITNHSPVMVQVLYIETMPWLIQFYLHTLEARLNGVKTGSSICSLNLQLYDQLIRS